MYLEIRTADPTGRQVDIWVRDEQRDIQSWNTGKEPNMLWTIFVILLVLWLLGLVSGYTMGGVIHILLVVAIVVVVIQLIQGRR
jgi:hypothetical protein